MSESTDPSKGMGLFSTLQSARKPSQFLLAALFLLFVDCILIKLGQPGIMAMASTTAKPDASFAVKLVLIFVLFSFFASMALELMANLFDAIWIEYVAPRISSINFRIESLFTSPDFTPRRKMRRHDCVSIYELMVAAHEEKDSYLLKLYEENSKLDDEFRKQRHEFSLYAFGMLLLVVWNDRLSSSGQTIAAEVTEYYGSTDWWWLITGTLLTLTVARFHFTRPAMQVYCPTLYDKLEAKDKEIREREAHIKRELQKNTDHYD